MVINNFKQAEAYLALHIPKNSQTTFPGELGLKRAKYFLNLLGRPQEKLKIIHVAGTSGKGSTCYLISSLLSSQGFKVGFHQSPHLTDVTERFQIKTSTSFSSSNQNISKEEFISYLNKIIPIINQVDKTTYGSLTYFEILVGLAYLFFYEKKVDYVVIETGLGGRYDATNTVSRSDKLSVITKIGLDHVAILGKTIEAISLQKALIINKNSQAISTYQDPRAKKVIREVAKKKQAKVIFVSPLSFRPSERSERVEESYSKDPSTSLGMTYKLGLIGDYQKENADLAIAIINFLSKRDGFVISQEKIKKVFETAKFAGRFDIKKILLAQASKNKMVIFDGAHNPQKMEAFISSLIKQFPNKKFNFLLAFKKGKDYQNMLKIIILKAAVGKIILTGFFTENQDMRNASEEPREIGRELNRLNQSSQLNQDSDRVNYEIIPSLKKAWKTILSNKDPIVVTGSLYLVGEIYRILKIK